MERKLEVIDNECGDNMTSLWRAANFVSIVAGAYLVFTLGLLGLFLFYLLNVFLCLWCPKELLNPVDNAKDGMVLFIGCGFLLAFFIAPFVSYFLIWIFFDAHDVFLVSKKLYNIGVPQSGFTALVKDMDNAMVDPSKLSKFNVSDAEVLLGILFHRMFVYLGIVVFVGITTAQSTQYSFEHLTTKKRNGDDVSNPINYVLMGIAAIAFAVLVDFICVSAYNLSVVDNFRIIILITIGIMFTALIIITRGDEIKGYFLSKVRRQL